MPSAQQQPFPPQGYIPAASALPGIELFMPAPVVEQEQAVVDFKCPQCGATTAYCIQERGLTCSYCGFYEPPHQAVVGKGAEAFEFTLEALSRAAHGWGVERLELQCQNCRAATSLPTGKLTSTCPFCGSNRVVQHAGDQNALRPRFLIPFGVVPDACRELATHWLGSSWMTPSALQRLARLAEFVPIYLPFWTFDARTRADWEAEVGHSETERYYEDGEWKTRTVTVWKWESGRAALFIDDLLIPGTSRLSAVLLNRLKDFDTRQLVEYEPRYLAGMQAQAYDVQLEAAWQQARAEMREQTREACCDQASTSEIRNFSMTLDFSDETWRYALFPVYVAVYRYEDRAYQVMINGQTGTMAGQRPVDWGKVWLAVALMLVPGLALALLGIITLIFGIGVIFLVFGLILLIVGGIFAFKTVQKAREMEHV